MRLAVFGGTGLTGGAVIARALVEGHDVVALGRDLSRVQLQHPRLRWEEGSAVEPADVARTVAGADVVIHCLGVGGRGTGQPTTLISDSVRQVLAGMEPGARLVCMSNVGVPGTGTWLANRIVVPLFLRWLKPIIDDKVRMEAALEASGADWISVRLPNIVEGEPHPVRTSRHGRDLALSVSHESVARFMLEMALAASVAHRTPCISR